VTLWVNAYEPAGVHEREWFELDRESLERPLHLGITGTPRAIPLTGEVEGLAMLAGWDERVPDVDVEVSFIYLRAT
jgi:hypothetical protein